MTAPIAGCAKVIGTTITTLGPKPAPDRVVEAGDVQEPTKLARLVGELYAKVAKLAMRWYPRRIDYQDVVVGDGGTTTRLAHGLNGRVRWSVVGWQTKAVPTTDDLLCASTMWLMRGLLGPPTLVSTAGNFTVGVRFRATAACQVSGARFLWVASTRTVSVTLWRDSDGAVLGTGTASCSDSGVYTVAFAVPVVLTGADLNVDLTLGVRDQAGAVYSRSGTDANFTNLLPIRFPGFSLRSIKLFSAGNARPTSSAGSELYWVEPLLTGALPQFVENTAATDNDTLVLTSYVAGKATIRIEETG